MYNLFRYILYLVLGIVCVFHGKMRRFVIKRLFQKIDVLNGEYYWVHSASVGEVNLSEKLVRGLLEKTNKRVLVTMMTDTGMATAKNKYENDDRVELLYFPIDDKRVIKKILSKINLKGLVIIETEIWPNLINECSKLAKVSMVNGRISDKSFKSYKKVSGYLKKLFAKIEIFLMQTEEDKERIVALGAHRYKVRNIGNMKFDIELEDFSEDEIKNIKKELNLEDKKIIVAGSTRNDEEEYVLEAYKELEDDYTLIIVPRHIERSDDISTRLLEGNYPYERWTNLSSGVAKETKVILVDAIGVLRKLYAISDIAYVGGTLVNVGGHSLLEPLYYGKAPIFGGYLQNVKEISKEVIKREIGYKIEDPRGFVESVRNLENGEINKVKIEQFFDENGRATSKALERIIDIT